MSTIVSYLQGRIGDATTEDFSKLQVRFALVSGGLTQWYGFDKWDVSITEDAIVCFDGDEAWKVYALSGVIMYEERWT